MAIFRTSLYRKVRSEVFLLKEISTEDFILHRKLRIWAWKWREEAVSELRGLRWWEAEAEEKDEH